MQSKTRGQRLTGLLAATVVLLILSQYSRALDQRPEIGGAIFGNQGELAPGACEATARLDVAVVRDVGLLVGDEVLIGSTVRFDASNAKVVKVGPDPTDLLNLAKCETSYHSIFDIAVGTPFQWEVLTKPATSVASLQGTDGLSPTLVVDRVGEYQVRFTGCPTVPCKLAEPGVGIPKLQQTLIVKAVSEVALPPETEPTLMPSKATDLANISNDEADRRCYGTSPALPETWYAPQLVTVNPWAGPQNVFI